jgi:hypothetical protein
MTVPRDWLREGLGQIEDQLQDLHYNAGERNDEQAADIITTILDRVVDALDDLKEGGPR